MQVIYLVISFIVLFLDQILKFYIANNFSLGQTKLLIPGLLSLNYIQNNGAAWNILAGQMWLFYLISIVAIGVCLYYLFKAKYSSKLFNIGISLVLGGILGNFIDRLHLKYVIDMIQLDFVQFNIFNLADSAITAGIVLIFIYLVFFDKEKD